MEMWTMVDGTKVQPGWVPTTALETRVLMGGQLPSQYPKKGWRWWGEKWYAKCATLSHGELWFGPFKSKDALTAWYDKVWYWGDITEVERVVVR